MRKAVGFLTLDRLEWTIRAIGFGGVDVDCIRLPPR